MTRNMGAQEFHLVGKNLPVREDEILSPIRNVRGINQFHSCFLGGPVSLEALTVPAGCHHVHPDVLAASRRRSDVITGQFEIPEGTTTVGTDVPIAPEKLPVV